MTKPPPAPGGLTRIKHQLDEGQEVGGIAQAFARIFGQDLLPELYRRFPDEEKNNGTIPDTAGGAAAAECRQASE